MQAAFVNYGKQRHGFLAFNDIQSDYYQIPHDDKDKLKKEEENLRLELKEKSNNAEENEKNARELSESQTSDENKNVSNTTNEKTKEENSVLERNNSI